MAAWWEFMRRGTLPGLWGILSTAGLSEDVLQTPPDYPLGEKSRIDQIVSGVGKTALAMNCSGKRAAMLATCVRNGWPIESYLDPDHLLHGHIGTLFAELTGEPVSADAVDGCGAPLLGTSLVGLAQAYRRLALGLRGDHAKNALVIQVADAMRAHPENLAGKT